MRQVFLSVLVCASLSAELAAGTGSTPPVAAPDPTPGPAPSAAEPAPIGPESVWNPPADFNEKFRAACARLEGSLFSDCFVAQMAKAGAPPPAVAFARRVNGMGFARTFHDAGRVDLVWAEYPYRANENRVCLIVNGDPPLLDIDDVSRIDQAELARNPIWASLLQRHPKAAIFPANREDTTRPGVQRIAGGGTTFTAGYEVHDGCHACAVIATMRVLWRFDAAGRFLGTEIKSIRRGRR